MTDAIWPTPNPAADALMARYLDRAAPGWRVRTLTDLDGEAVMELLWPLTSGRATEAGPVTPMQEIALDEALERLAATEDTALERLAPGAQSAFISRLLTAIAAAASAMTMGGAVIRLPPRLAGRSATARRSHSIALSGRAFRWWACLTSARQAAKCAAQIGFG